MSFDRSELNKKFDNKIMVIMIIRMILSFGLDLFSLNEIQDLIVQGIIIIVVYGGTILYWYRDKDYKASYFITFIGITFFLEIIEVIAVSVILTIVATIINFSTIFIYKNLSLISVLLMILTMVQFSFFYQYYKKKSYLARQENLTQEEEE